MSVKEETENRKLPFAQQHDKIKGTLKNPRIIHDA
jgi:hypothetical protein